MDIEFVYLDTMENLRPKIVIHKTFLDAARGVEERFESETNEQEGKSVFHICLST